MALFVTQSKIQPESFKGKMFVGIVVDNNDNNDPNKPKDKPPLQRCKVRCRGVHEGMDDASLPWAMKGQHAGGDQNKVDVPPLGTEVMIEFQDDTIYHPIWHGSRQTYDNANPELTSTNYPNQIGEIDRSGNKFVRDTKTDAWEFTHVSGSQITFDGFGHIKLVVADGKVGPDATTTVPKGITIEIQGPCSILAKEDINIKTQGTTNIEAVGQVNIRAAKINLNDQGPNVSAPAVPPARTRPKETPFLNQINYA